VCKKLRKVFVLNQTEGKGPDKELQIRPAAREPGVTKAESRASEARRGQTLRGRKRTKVPKATKIAQNISQRRHGNALIRLPSLWGCHAKWGP